MCDLTFGQILLHTLLLLGVVDLSSGRSLFKTSADAEISTVSKLAKNFFAAIESVCFLLRSLGLF